MIHKVILTGLLMIFLVACNQESNQTINTNKTEAEKKPVKETTVAKTIKPKITKLYNSNLITILTEYGNKNKETIVLLKTSKGNMKIRLYQDTPLHRANFLRLAKNGFYKGTEFYRVVKGFMIQGGDSDDDNRADVKKKFGRCTIPSEINLNHIHKKGAVAMTREYENNPEKRSAPYEFYLVQGEIYTKSKLKAVEIEKGLSFTEEQREIYTTIGGTPHLDGDHSVFGEVIEGINIIDSIANARVDESNWPHKDIKINIEIIE